MDLKRDYPNIHVSLVMPGLVSTDFARHAVGSSGGAPPPWVSGGSMQAQTPEEVASAIAGVIDRPIAEMFTNPSSAPMARRYFEDVGAFEEALHSRSAPRGPQPAEHG